jgi:trimeric autotransporter adhesin
VTKINSPVLRRVLAAKLLAGIALVPGAVFAQVVPAGVATGTNAVAIGVASFASGNQAAAIGNRSTATVVGGVALGANSTDAANNNSNGVAPVATTGPISVQYNNAANTYVGAVSVGSATPSLSSPLVPAFTRQIKNVADGSAPTDAVTVRQLSGVASAANQTFLNLGSTAAANFGGGVTYDNATGLLSAPNYSVGGVAYNNVGSALGAQNTIVTALGNSAASIFGGTTVYDPATGAFSGQAFTVGGTTYGDITSALGAVGTTLASQPLQYSTGGAPTTANPGVPSNDVTLVGAIAGTPVALHNVAAGALTATSTDAVNGAQLNATNIAVAGNSAAITNLTNGTAGLVQQTGGAPGNGGITVAAATGGTTVNFAGTTGARTLQGVAAGAVTATSTDAVNGAQLSATNGAVATTAAGLTALTSNINAGSIGLVQQVGGAPGTGQLTVGGSTGGTSISVAGMQGARTIGGVANGVTPTDAVNVGQLNASAAQTLGAAQLYTDRSLASFDLRNRDKINEGVATAAAIAGVPQAVIQGQGFIGAGIGFRGNKMAVAIGMSKVFEGRHAPIVKAGVAFGTRGGGATYNVGGGFHF